MSVGAFELVFLALVTLFAIAALIVAKRQWTWIVGIPICVAIAVLVTASDIASTFVVAAPLALVYTYIALARKRKTSRVDRVD